MGERGSLGRCPICGRPGVVRFRPFCSARCADIDLGHWLSGRYAIPTEEGPDGAEPGSDEAAPPGEADEGGR